MPYANKNTERKLVPVVVVLVGLLVFLFISAHSANVGWANPYSQARDSGTIAAPFGTRPPALAILSPENNSNLNSTSISLNFSVGVGEPGTWIDRIFYSGDWQKTSTYINFTELNYTLPPTLSVVLTDAPEGNHSITVVAMETGLYYADLFHYYHFYVDSLASVKFSVDTTLPTVSIESVENKTYLTSDIQLNFTVNEPSSRISYVLDGQVGVPIFGNTTIHDLFAGPHKIVVCAVDDAGNLGTSTTVNFTIAEPDAFPVAPAVAVSLATVAIAGVGAVIYHSRKKR